MKRFLISALALLMLCSCAVNEKTPTQTSESVEATQSLVIESETTAAAPDVIHQSVDDTMTFSYSFSTAEETLQTASNGLCEEFRGLWMAIYELAPENSDKEKYALKLEKMMKNTSQFGFTDIFVQVRANCDAIYKSEIFPPCYLYSKDGKLFFDALSMICDTAHKYSLKVHAWINPYRICADSDKQPVNIPAGVDESSVYNSGKSYYLDPCSSQAYNAVISGVREILEGYNVDGIHIDDYFYPTQSEEIDKNEYDAYLKSGGTLSLAQFRRNSVSSLVSSIYSLVKSKNANIMFSVSPSADIKKNTNMLYADVELWSSREGYCDMIIPQIYFGFENENMPFKSTYDGWRALTDKSKVRLCAGLAIYKSGKEDGYAGEKGKDEWKNNSDIIKRQVEYLRENRADGFCIFSYNYVFGDNNLTNKEKNNLKSVL